MIIDWGQDGLFAGQVSSGSSIRQQIVDAIEGRFSLITIANGYTTDVGQNIFVWKSAPFQESERPGMDIRDVDDAVVDNTVGEALHTLPIECRCLVGDNASMEDVRKITADITTACATDFTWGGLAEDTGHVQGGLGNVEIGDQVITAVVVKFDVTYLTERFNPYA